MSKVVKHVFKPSTIIAGITGFFTGGPLGAAVAVAGSAYQQSQYEKQKQAGQRQVEQMADQQKGFELSVDGEPISLPIVYGRVALGGVRTSFKTSNDYTHSADANQSFKNGLTTNVSGEKNEFLYYQQALCQGGIEGVVAIDVSDIPYDDSQYDHGLRIDVNTNGGVMDLGTDNGFSSTDRFTDVTYATAVFRLNRDDPQFNGIPTCKFYVKGQKVENIDQNGNKVGKYFTENPAYILYDYLTEDYGLGLSDDLIDLASFGKAAFAINQNLQTSVDWYGKVNNDNNSSVVLYECNLVIDRAQPVRSNIQAILQTMGQADLIWSDGKYKLKFEYPSTQEELDAVVVKTFTDDDIIRDNVSIVYVGALNKFNQATINFNNSFEDFTKDTIVWPENGSSTLATYLEEDNNLPLSTSISVLGITNPYHARHRAWQTVIDSRQSKVYTFTATSDAFLLEPGDFIKINSTLNDINNQYAKVIEIKVNEDSTVKVTAKQFFYQNNVSPFTTNFAAPVTRTPADFTVAAPTNLQYFNDSDFGGAYGSDVSGVLSWDASDDVAVSRYGVFVDGAFAAPVFLGYTANTIFEIPPLSLNPLLGGATTVDFKVFAETATGRRSAQVSLNNQTVDPSDSTTLQFNAPSGADAAFDTSGTLTWSNFDAKIKTFVVQYRASGDSDFIDLGTTAFKKFVLPVLKDDDYDFSVYGLTGSGRPTSRTTITNQTIGLGLVSNIAFLGQGSSQVGFGSSGKITWDEPAEISTINRYIVELAVSGTTDWVKVGDSLVTEFELPSIAEGIYDIGVTSVTATGKLSTRVTLDDQEIEPANVTANNALLTLFKRTTTDSTPATPTNTFSYIFSPPSLSDSTGNGWTLEYPSNIFGTYLWSIQQAVTSFNDSVPVNNDSFSTPVIILNDGTTGENGDRGAGRWTYRVGTSLLDSPSQATLDGYMLSASGYTPIDGDQLWLYSSPNPETYTPDDQQVWLFEDPDWNRIEEVILGDLLVEGTISTDKLRVGDVISTGNITIQTSPTGERVFMDSTGMSVFDASDNLRVKIGLIS